jgi:hypothetical protein
MIKVGNILFPELEEVTIQMFNRLNATTSDWETLTALCDCENATEAEVVKLITFADALKAKIQEWLNNPTPVPFKVLSTEIKQTNIDKLPYWATARAKTLSHIEDAYNKYIEYPLMVAHYTYSVVTGKSYNEYEAEEFVNVINDTDFRIVVGLGDFFLFKQNQKLIPKQRFSSRILTRLKLKPA